MNTLLLFATFSYLACTIEKTLIVNKRNVDEQIELKYRNLIGLLLQYNIQYKQCLYKVEQS